jgi:hypothetical protein
MTTSPEASMLLITSVWAEKPTFKLMPIVNSSLFVEGIYDTESKVLVLITTVKKDSFHMVPKLSEDGDPTKTKTPRMNGKNYKEERKQLETFQEYYITEKAEIEEFIKMIAINADSFDFKQYTDKSNLIIETEKPKIIMP